MPVKEHELLVEQRFAEDKFRLTFVLVHPDCGGVIATCSRFGVGTWPGQKTEFDTVAFLGQQVTDQMRHRPLMLELCGQVWRPFTCADSQ
jgi:hypothetical protein